MPASRVRISAAHAASPKPRTSVSPGWWIPDTDSTAAKKKMQTAETTASRTINPPVPRARVLSKA